MKNLLTYKCTVGILKHIVVQVLHQIHNDNCLTHSQLYGIVAVIPKAEKDQLHIKNWRPLTLLHTLYKLESAVLASRHKFVLSRILGSNQKSYVPKDI